MMGGAIHKPEANKPVVVRYTEEIVVKEDGKVFIPDDHITREKFARPIVASTQHPIRMINLGGSKESNESAGSRTQITEGTLTDGATVTFTNPAMGVNGIAPKVGDHIRIFWEEEVNESDADYAVEVTISPDTFPGTYRVVGDTFMRSQATGKDEAFQFVINKAKVLSEVTITLEAEGDPSTFEMTLNVLRSDNERGEKEMMKLIRYGGAAADSTTSGKDIGSLSSGS